MTSSSIAIVSSMFAGLASSRGPPDLTTLLHQALNIPEFTTLLSSPPYNTTDANTFFPQKQGAITILIPNNAAFALLPLPTLETAFEDNSTATIREVLRYHMREGVPTIAS